MKYHLIVGLVLLLLSCKSPELFLSHRSEYSSCVSTYIGNPKNRSNLHKRVYYDSVGNLRELVFYGGDITTIKYFYDSNHVQLEKFRCLRNCDNGIRIMYKYDSVGRLLGQYKTMLSAIDIDTCAVEQLYFYDEQNRLIKEKVSNYRDFVQWKHINYINGQVSEEVQTVKADTISFRYYYHNGNLLDSVQGKNERGREFMEYYLYNSDGRLVEKKSLSNKSPRSKKSYDPIDQKILYIYDAEGKLIKITKFSTDKKSNYSIYYLYEKNTANST